MGIFIIGLPKGVRAPLLTRAQERGVALGYALAAPDRRGVLALVPHDAQACSDLEIYCDGADWSTVQIIRLPYVPISDELAETLKILRDGGAVIVSPTPGDGVWPAVEASGRYGGGFNNDTLAALFEHLGWQGPTLPSTRFERASNRYPNEYLIMPGALDACNNVDRLRFRFLYDSGDALEEFCRKRGAIGESLFSFFEERGIEFVTTGGIKTTLRIMRNGRQLGPPLHEHLHLKEGDATTPQAAARIYFQHFEKDEKFRLVLFYVGPHPEHDIDRSIEWEAD